METLRIVKDQPFVLWVPTIMLNADGEEAVDATSLTDVTTTAVSGCESIDIAHHAYEHWIVLEFGGDLKVGPYNIKIAGTLSSGRPFALALSKAVEIVNWDKESNWDRFIVGDHLELLDHPFITGDFITDADYERLKAELVAAREEAEAAKAEAEAAKEELERKAEELEDVAKETTSQEIKELIQTEISTQAQYMRDFAKDIEYTNDYAAQLRAIMGDWEYEPVDYPFMGYTPDYAAQLHSILGQPLNI